MKRNIVFVFCAALLVVCVGALGIQAAVPQAGAAGSDEALEKRVQVAVKGASGLLGLSDEDAAQIKVSANRGVVTLSGPVSSKGLRGATYSAADLKQNLAAVVRLVPGVEDVHLSLQTDAAVDPTT